MKVIDTKKISLKKENEKNETDQKKLMSTKRRRKKMNK